MKHASQYVNSENRGQIHFYTNIMVMRQSSKTSASCFYLNIMSCTIFLYVKMIVFNCFECANLKTNMNSIYIVVILAFKTILG